MDLTPTLELSLERYPTQTAMLTYLQSLLYVAETHEMGAWQLDYVVALWQAVDVIKASESPKGAIATLHGYRAYMRAQRQPDDDDHTSHAAGVSAS